jgi:1-deoxy-D-xylulose-5-phosphate synthase
VSIRYPRGKGAGVPLDDELSILPIGRGEVLHDGSDLAIIAVGVTVHPALAAARSLALEGIQIKVINARFIKPLDSELLLSTAASVRKILTIEENVLDGGFGSAVLELLAQNGVTGVTVRRLGVGDKFVEHATQAELRSQYDLDEAGIIRVAKEMLEKSC